MEAKHFGTLSYTPEELASWDQRDTLRPPPYKLAMARVAAGLLEGDPLMADVPTSKLSCHGRPGADFPVQEEPEWVDWASVERGQQQWLKHASRSFAALSLALLSGFSIARFAEVLHKNGYAHSASTALERYRATGFLMTDFYRSSLRDPQSKARKAIANVRAMHEWARRRSGHLFDAEKGEGIPLCQLDMAEVQLGFSGVCMDLIESELGYGPIDPQDAEDMAHCWRVVGYHLGIQDEYNVCNSLEDLRACTADFMAFTPRRLETLRECTHDLRRTAIDGFGMETGLGSNFWNGAFDLVFLTPRVEISHLRPQGKYLPGMDLVARTALNAFRYDAVAAIVAKHLLKARDDHDADPKNTQRRLRVTKVAAAFHDRVTWRILSLIYLARHLLAVLIAVRLARRLRAALSRSALLR